jgi:sugar lactone lactonase YvrE
VLTAFKPALRNELTMRSPSPRAACLRAVFSILLASMSGVAANTGHAAEPRGFLETVRRHTLLTSTVTPSGDQNPYAVVVAPVSAGKIQKNDVLVTNFNNSGNLQGLGTTIVDWNPSAKRLSVFASIPRHLSQCPGGIGLTTALTMLKSGWMIVGSLPSQDGTTATKGNGCLLVLDAQGNVATALTSPNINGPWGNLAVIDNGGTATVFVSNTGFGVTAPGQDAVNKANVLRLDLAIPESGPPRVLKETVIASGFGEKADKDVFVIGPTGLALGRDGTLYVSDAIGNRIVAIPDAATRTTSAGQGREVTRDGFLRRPLAMAVAPNGHLLVVNGLNGQLVEIDAEAGRQIYAQWIDPNRAQTPPGAGDLFGIAMTPEGDGFYYVEDEVAALVLAH